MPETLNLTINGHPITIEFTQESNPNLAQTVRNTLLDAYIRQKEQQNFVGNPS